MASSQATLSRPLKCTGCDMSVCTQTKRGQDSSANKTSDRKARRSTDAGSFPQCGKGFFFSQSQLSPQTLSWYSYRPRAQSHASASACTLRISSTVSHIPSFGHAKILYTLVGVGSASLAAAVAFPRSGDQNFLQGIKLVSWCFTPSQPVRLYQGEQGIKEI